MHRLPDAYPLSHGARRDVLARRIECPRLRYNVIGVMNLTMDLDPQHYVAHKIRGLDIHASAHDPINNMADQAYGARVERTIMPPYR